MSNVRKSNILTVYEVYKKKLDTMSTKHNKANFGVYMNVIENDQKYNI